MLRMALLTCALVYSCDGPVVHINGTDANRIRAIIDSPEMEKAISEGAEFDKVLIARSPARFPSPMPGVFLVESEHHRNLVRRIEELPSIFIRNRTSSQVLFRSGCRCTDKPIPNYYYIKVRILEAESHANLVWVCQNAIDDYSSSLF